MMPSSNAASASLNKEETSSASLQQSHLRSRRMNLDSDQTSSAEAAVENASSATSTIHETQSETAAPRFGLAVRQVQNDQKPTLTGSSTSGSGDQTWIWWFADYATLAFFIIVSVCILAFSLDRFANIAPDAGVLSQRLGESYDLLVQELSYVLSAVSTAAKAVYQDPSIVLDGIQRVMRSLSVWDREE